MCIIIHRPAGAATRLSRDTLQRCATRNPHGFGIMWTHKGKLHTARYLPSERKDFIKRALLIQDADCPMVLHFRWATHGAVTKDNTHPFIIERGQSALMHNGIFSIPCVKGWSDTRTLAREVIAKLPPQWDKDPALRWMVEQATLGSKVAIMYADSTVTILHRKSGISEGGIWYSNDGFRPGLDRDEWAAAAASWNTKTEAEKVKIMTEASERWEAQKAREKAGKKGAGSLPIQSSALYRFEGITICGWCLAREDGTDDAILVEEPAEGEQCELCYHSPHVSGSREVSIANLGKVTPDCQHRSGTTCEHCYPQKAQRKLTDDKQTYESWLDSHERTKLIEQRLADGGDDDEAYTEWCERVGARDRDDEGRVCTGA